MTKLLALVGPSVMVASVAYVYNRRQTSSFPVSMPMYVFLLFIVYAAGIIPRCAFFPDRFFKPNIFPLLYKLYCSQGVGYRFLKPIMHASAQYPHSDYRTATRLLSGSRGEFTFLAVSPASTEARTAASAAARYYDKRDDVTRTVCNGARGTKFVDVSAVATQRVKTGTLVVPVPMFADNYAYLIVSLDTHKAVAVDPADPKAVLQLLRALERTIGEPLQLTEVLTTHKHWDHAGGNEELLGLSRRHPAAAAPPTSAANRDETPATSAQPSALTGIDALAYLVSPELEIIGSQVDQPMACTRLVAPTDLVYVAGKAVAVRVLQAPGHTRGSVMYVAGDVPPSAPTSSASTGVTAIPTCTALFTGDALFSGGFGAPFETSSLHDVAQTRRSFLSDPAITTHPHTGEAVADDAVLIYCGHEYTERILTEVESITRKLVQAGSGTASLQNYLRDVIVEAKRVRALRVASDGLEDVANEARTPGTGSRPAYRLPISSMPTTLAIEKRINPLLTLDEDAFKDPSVQPLWSEATFDQGLLERLLYCSPHRCVCESRTKADSQAVSHASSTAPLTD